MPSPRTVIRILDQNYLYKSVATQIPHNAGLEPILAAEDITRTYVCEAESLPLSNDGERFCGYIYTFFVCFEIFLLVAKIYI